MKSIESKIQTLLSIVGVFIGFIIASWFHTQLSNCTKTIKTELLVTSISEKPNETNKQLLFVGVMTADIFLNSRVKAVYETWGQKIPGKIVFFSGANTTRQNKIPLVSLPGVDDVYPPMKKFYVMLKYMYDHYIDDFEWFLRADDDAYVKTDKMETFLRSMNSSKPLYIGQMGKGRVGDFGLLALEDDENFCMGGTGVLMSRETLRLIGPHLGKCVKNLFSKHDDVEISRCIKKYANATCVWSFDVSINFFRLSLF
jgi:chondroitin sulfate synthase